MKRLVVGLVCLVIGLSGVVNAQTAKQKEEVDLLVKIIKNSKDGKQRAGACNELADLGLVRTALIKPAEPTLVEALKDSEGEVRASAVRALQIMGEYKKAWLPNLLPLLKEGENRNARLGAVILVGKTVGGAPEAVPALEEIQKKEAEKPDNMRDGEMLGRVNEALVGIRAQLLEGWIKTLADDKDAKQRLKAAAELVKVAQTKSEQAKSAIPVLVGALKDEEAEVRKTALTALTFARPEPQVMMPGLIAILKNIREDRVVRLTAISMAGAAGPNAREALPFLEFALDREKKKPDADKEMIDKLTQAIEAIKK